MASDVGNHLVKCTPWPPFIAIGPPGTGKTETLAYSIISLLSGWSTDKQILFCTRSLECVRAVISNYFECPNIEEYLLLEPGSGPQSCASALQASHLSDGCPLIITTFDMLEELTTNNEAALHGLTHVVFDDVSIRNLGALHTFLNHLETRVCIAIAVGMVTDESAESISVFPFVRSERVGEFIGRLCDIMSKPSENILLDDFSDRLYKNYSYSGKMLQFVNHYVLNGHDEMESSEATVEYNVPPVILQEVDQPESCVSAVVNIIRELCDTWPDAWSDRRLNELAVITDSSQDELEVQKTLVNQSSNFSEVKCLTADRVHGLYFNAVCVMIRKPSENEVLSKCYLNDRCIELLMTRARYRIFIVVDTTNYQSLSNSSMMWKRIFDYCQTLDMADGDHMTNNSVPFTPNTVLTDSSENAPFELEVKGGELNGFSENCDEDRYRFSDEDSGSDYSFSSFKDYSEQPTSLMMGDDDPVEDFPIDEVPTDVLEEEDTSTNGAWGSEPDSDDDLGFMFTRDFGPVEYEDQRVFKERFDHYIIKTHQIASSLHVRRDSESSSEDGDDQDESVQSFHEPPEYEAAKNEVDLIYPDSYEIPNIQFLPYADRISEYAFTIGSDDGSSVAYCLKTKPDGSYEFNFYVSDVTYFTTDDSEIDKYAKARAFSVHLPNEHPHYILPDRLSRDLVSLKQGHNRLCFSIDVVVTSNYEATIDKLGKAVINVKSSLRDDIVDAYLTNGDDGGALLTSELKKTLNFLETFSETLKKKRLGIDSICYSGFESKSRSVGIVTELAILINSLIAEKLIEKFPHFPVLSVADNKFKLTEWRKQFLNTATFSPCLNRFYHKDGEVCSCISDCEYVSSLRNSLAVPDQKMVKVIESKWSYVNENNIDKLDVFSDCSIYPEAILALHKKMKTFSSPRYLSSSDDDRGHNLLNLSYFVTFAQPFQRYIDIFMQRMINSLIYPSDDDDKYTLDRIDMICLETSNNLTLNHISEYPFYAQLIYTELKLAPIPCELIIVKIDDAFVSLANPRCINFPTVYDDRRHLLERIRTFFESIHTLKFNSLSLSEKPSFTGEKSVTLNWEELIYSINTISCKKLWETNDGFQIRSEPAVKNVPTRLVKDLFSFIRDGNMAEVLETTNSITDFHEVSDDDILDDINSEVVRTRSKEPAVCKFWCNLDIGACLRVQFATFAKKVDYTPRIQLVTLTPTLDICVEHVSNKALCFVDQPQDRVDDDSYIDNEEYSKRWMHLLMLEAAEQSVSGDTSIIIHDLTIKWEVDKESNPESIKGTFQLSSEFCSTRNVPRDGFVCVRYKNMKIDKNFNDSSLRKLFPEHELYTWVGHCVVTQSIEMIDKQIRIVLTFHQSSSKFPDVLFTEEGSTYPCTVQCMPCPRPFTYMKDAITRSVEGSMSYMMKTGSILDNKSEVVFKETGQFQNCFTCNAEQEEAINSSLYSNFSLIHGPPGTGKTQTAAELIYRFCKLNELNDYKRKREKWQVLYCAPSNKAADVILGYFSKMRSSKRPENIIRVYSGRIENQSFGNADTQRSIEQSNFVMDPKNRLYALHWMIREPHRSVSSEILGYDTILKNFPEMVDAAFKKKFYHLKFKAAKELLMNANVVISTCTGCCTSVLKKSTSFRQVIIDEAGMCSEPETLVPIYFTNPYQVTLIGDHKQLQPVLLTDFAKELGMLRSMFERYINSGLTVMLSTQYRMHEKIQKVPSLCYYDNKLMCGADDQRAESQFPFWPGGHAFPLAFCDVYGSENTTVVSTSESNDRSKSNAMEADVVKTVVEHLLTYYNVGQSQLAVLTLYRAQVSLIESLLQEKYPQLTIRTVISSQGDEWDYVVLSTVRSLDLGKFDNNPSSKWVKDKLGFITDEHQINVSLTRARKGLIIVGNKLLLKCHPDWKKLIDYYQQNGAIIKGDDFVEYIKSQIHEL